MESTIKNDKQLYFNQIKGKLVEINDGEKYCSVTLSVGHDNIRSVNLVMKKNQFDTMVLGKKLQLTDNIMARFFVSSRFKNGRWYTMANTLDLCKC
jgi:hypothetical protein